MAYEITLDLNIAPVRMKVSEVKQSIGSLEKEATGVAQRAKDQAQKEKAEERARRVEEKRAAQEERRQARESREAAKEEQRIQKQREREDVRAKREEDRRRNQDGGFNYIAGANAQVAKAEQGLLMAQLANDPAKIRDAQVALERARARQARDEKFMDGPQEKTQQEKIMEALMSSRIGRNGQLYPLVGKLHAAGLANADELKGKLTDFGLDPGKAARLAPMVASVASAAMPLLLAGGAAVAAGAAAYKIAEVGVASMRAGASAYWAGGGTPGETGQAMAIGRFLGVDPAQRALELAERLNQGSYGSAYMRSRGITDFGGRTIDKTKNYLRSIDELYKIKDDDQAIRVARDIGMERELWMRDLSPGTKDRLTRSMGDAGSKSERRAAAEYEAEKTMLSSDWDKFVRFASRPFVAGAGTVMRTVNSMEATDWAQALNPGTWMRKGSQAIGERLVGGSAPSKELKEAAKELKDAGRTLKSGPEMIGGGSRTRGAVPAGWRYAMMEDALSGQAQMMGAF